MLKLKGKFNAPNFDLQKYKNELERQARETLGRAILEYVVTFQQIVPVWSGASHATLTQLAGLISAPLAIQISTTAYDREGYGRGHGSAVLVANAGEYGFVFETDLPHLVYNEYNDANANPDPGLRGKLLNPGPYDFQTKVGAAVTTVLREFQLPDLNSALRTRRVR